MEGAKKKNENKGNGISPLFQLACVSVTFLILTFFVWRVMNRFCIWQEEAPPLEYVTPDTIERLSIVPHKVSVGLTITGFSEFNIIANKFVMAAVIWFKYNPNDISDLQLDKFSFEHGRIKKKEKQFTFLDDNNVVLQYNIQVRFHTPLYHGFFPFMDHKVYLVLKNNAVSLSHIMFDVAEDAFVLKADEMFENSAAYPGYGVTRVGSRDTYHPKVVFELDYFYQSLRYISLILLPLFLLFLIELFSYTLDQEKNRSLLLGVAMGNLGALYAYRFVIQTLAPDVAYMTLADYVFFIFLSTTFMTFFINGLGPLLSRFQRKAVSIGLQLYVVIVCFYLMNFWVTCQ